MSRYFSSDSARTVHPTVYAKEQGEFDVAFAIAAILMIMTLIINFLADFLGRMFKRRRDR